jgi:hypothetical protein
VSEKRFALGRTKVLIGAALAAILWVGCSDDSLIAPDDRQGIELDLLDLAPDVQIQELSPATLVLRRNTDRLMSQPGVVATAVGLTDRGRPALQVYHVGPFLDGPPSEIDGLPVVLIETLPIVALQEAQERRDPVSPQPGPPCPPKCGGGGGDGGSFDPTAKHRPAPNGVSLGHPNITAGTLGAIVTNGNSTYILSNNHVLANENKAGNGDNALQPGPFDGGNNPGDAIGTLSDYEAIVFTTSANNVVDAAIAIVNPADVTGATESGGYGAPRSQTVTASVGMRVMKYGRTTSQTKGRVQGINATVNVGYSTGVARFVDQIVIGGGGFSAGGDSGSLIVGQSGSDARKPVGLLFAGGGGTTIANPIDDVLAAFGVTIVGN